LIQHRTNITIPCLNQITLQQAHPTNKKKKKKKEQSKKEKIRSPNYR